MHKFRVLLSALLAAPLLAFGADYPAGPVKFVHAFPGGLVDGGARAFAELLGARWGQPAVVESKPGANEILAADSVAKSPKEGQTLLVATETPLANNLYLYRKLPFDPVQDLVPVTELFRVRFGLVVRGDLPVNSVPEFIALMKKDGARHSYASSGPGGPLHLAMESFRRAANFDMTHVPYKTIAQVSQDLLGGRVDAIFISVPFALPFVPSGKLKILGVTGQGRLASAPTVPTFAELGFPQVDYTTTVGLMAPAGTPPAVVAKLAADARAVARSDEFARRFLQPNGLEAVASEPQQFAAALAARRAATQRLMQALDIKPE
ncbi:MAG TPA: tripartite tricarboxylate transporter substrate binding protein [Ramlibacter sp.]|nr:tripartite tricarboxylate transporter substrate binding protein [Ramlibacter sp.]